MQGDRGSRRNCEKKLRKQQKLSRGNLVPTTLTLANNGQAEERS
jgi:hypothetical protein